jgi:hypothetical protein
MYKLIKNSIIFILFFFWSCGNKTAVNNSSEVINVNPYEATDYVNLSEIVDSVKCIKLQTDSGDVMGIIREIIIKKKYIYAIDALQEVIFVFNKEGKFVSKLDKKGEGPDEYGWMGYVFIDDDEEYIEVIDLIGKGNFVKLKYANISFELDEVSPFPEVYANTCKRINGIYYYSTQQLDNIINGKKTNAGLVIANDTTIEKTLFDKDIETKGNSYSPNVESFTTNNKDEFFLSLMYDNTFYQLEDGEATPVLTIDFGKYGMNNSIGLQSLEKQMEYIKNMQNRASFPVLNINNDAIMSFSYWFKQDENLNWREDFRQYIKIKKSNKVYHVKQIKNDITDFPNRVYITTHLFSAHESWYEDYLVDVVVPSFYFSDDDPEKIFVDGLGEITADDDLIVVMMKLKKDL